MMDYIDRAALLDTLREAEKDLRKVNDNVGTRDARNSAYGKWIMLADCIMKIKEQPGVYTNGAPEEQNTVEREMRMTRQEKVRQCLEGIEEGQIKLQAHVQSYGASPHSELLAWICVGLRLVLERELRDHR